MNFSKANFLKLIQVFCFIILSVSNLIQSDQNKKNVQALPKLPLYVGSSYHILYGNPKDQNTIDPGFYQLIFDFSYTRNQTTWDSKYLIPDQTTSFSVDRCYLNSLYDMYRGTSSYQQNLRPIAGILNGPDRIVSKAFSLSKNFQKILNLTSNQKATITQARAECQVYDIFLSKVFQAPLTEAFKRSAIQAYTSGDWNKFIQTFGTHYVTEMLVGGRVFQQSVYNYLGIQKILSLNIKLNDATWASFAKYYNDTDFDISKYSKQINYSQLIVKQRTQFYVSAQPPKNGSVVEWQQRVTANPLPLYYNMTLLSGLFDRIIDANFNPTKAVLQFEDTLTKLCDKLGCKPLTPDFPQPAPAYTIIQNTTQYGSCAYVKSPVDFYQFFNSTTMDMKKLYSRTAKYCDNIQLTMGDGVYQKVTNSYGGPGGVQGIWNVPSGQYVNQVEVWATNVVDALSFKTNKGSSSPKYGGPGGNYNMLTFPPDYKIVGLYGRYGTYHPTNSSINVNVVCKLGFVLAKTVYPSQQNQLTNLLQE